MVYTYAYYFANSNGIEIESGSYPEGWGLTFSGLVAIPSEAPVGNYIGIYSFVDHANENPEGFWYSWWKKFEFQVVPDVYRPPGPGDPICSL